MKQMAEKKGNDSFQVVAEMGFGETFRGVHSHLNGVSECVLRP